MGQWVKNLPIMLKTQETQIQSLGREDLLEEEMVTHSSILAWKIAWTEEPGRLHTWDLKEFEKTEQLTHTLYNSWRNSELIPVLD